MKQNYFLSESLQTKINLNNINLFFLFIKESGWQVNIWFPKINIKWYDVVKVEINIYAVIIIAVYFI